MSDRELRAEIVYSRKWLYDDQVVSEVWIVKQNFEYNHEDGYSDDPEELNSDGETYQVLTAREDRTIGPPGPAKLSLADAIAAEDVIPAKIDWTNHTFQRLFDGRSYSLTPRTTE